MGNITYNLYSDLSVYYSTIENDVKEVLSEQLNEAELTPDEIKRLFHSAEKLTKKTSVTTQRKEIIDRLVDKITQRSKHLETKVNDELDEEEKEELYNKAEDEFNDFAEIIRKEAKSPKLWKHIKGIGVYLKNNPGKLIAGLGVMAAARSFMKNKEEDEAAYVLGSFYGDEDVDVDVDVDVNKTNESIIEEGIFDSLTQKISSIADKIATSHHVDSIKQKSLGNKDELDYKDLMKVWMRNDAPTDSNEIISLLKREGFSNKDIKKSFKDAGIPLSFGRDEIVIRLTDVIKRHNFETLIKNHLKKDYGIKISESFDNMLIESIITEDTLSDEQIREIFSTIVDITKRDPDYTQEDMNEYIKDWAKELNAASTQNEKIMLVKEVVNLLAKHKNHPDWDSVRSTVEKILKRSIRKQGDTVSAKITPSFARKAISNIRTGQVMESDMYLAATYLLSECNLTWSDLSLKPRKINNNTYRIDQMVGKHAIIVEELFRDVLAYEKISQYGKNKT